MTGDYFLDQFQLPYPERDIYRLGQYSPVSIRDQVVRGCYLVERLWTTGRLTRNSYLLVVGAGAAGVTVAIRAAQYGCRPVIVDSGVSVLSLQANCTTRWIDPVQYDWPAPHWDGERWPIKEPAALKCRTATNLYSPVTLEADFADEWAAKFERALDAFVIRGAVYFIRNHKVRDWQPAGPAGYSVSLEDTVNGAISSRHADVMIYAGGLGREIVSVPVRGNTARYSTPPFWSDDTFEKTDFGLNGIRHGVLVSGGGDGALQDFIRLVTGQRSARDIWSAVEKTLGPATRREIEALWHWEALCDCSRSFAPEYGSPCKALEALHERYAYLINTLVMDPIQWTAVISALSSLIPASRRSDRVFLALKSNHFDRCYPLNRLVALVCIAYLRHRYPHHDPVLKSVAVRNVRPSNVHKPWGTSMQVELALSTSCNTTASQIETWSGKTVTRDFDALVVRHGIDPGSLNINAPRLQTQPVPAHLP